MTLSDPTGLTTALVLLSATGMHLKQSSPHYSQAARACLPHPAAWAEQR